MDFINTLSESKLIPSTSTLGGFSAENISELLYVYVCSLRILLKEDYSRKWACEYAKNTSRFGNYTRWANSSTDMYVLIYGLVADDVVLRHQDFSNKYKSTLPIGLDLLHKWLKDAGQGNDKEMAVHQLLNRLDFNLRVRDGSLKAIRRMVLDWNRLEFRDKQLTMTRILQIMRSRCPRSELLPMLEKLSKMEEYELMGVDNQDTGTGSLSNVSTPKKNGSFLSSLAGFAAGAATGYALVRKK